jgi:peptidoglycan/LPS O-acetylase OafA/YrhL
VLLYPALWLVPVVLYALHPGAPETILSHLDWFAWGLALAHLSVSDLGARANSLMGTNRAAVGLIVLAMLAYLGAATSHTIVRELAFGLFGASLVAVGAASGSRSWADRALTVAPVAWLGLISYGIYLWHVPLILALHRHSASTWVVFLALPMAIAAAAVSFYLVERPILRWVRRKDRGSSSEADRRNDKAVTFP